jgi:hypothetical protein
MWLILSILVWLLEVCYLWRFYSVLLAALALAGFGDWLLPEASAWRGMGVPLVVGGGIAGMIWEVVASQKKKENPAIVTLADKTNQADGENITRETK